MAKYLVNTDHGPEIIEADSAALGNQGSLIFVEGEGYPVAAFVAGRWISFKRLDDTQAVH